jgi:hypothetical protein
MAAAGYSDMLVTIYRAIQYSAVAVHEFLKTTSFLIKSNFGGIVITSNFV